MMLRFFFFLFNEHLQGVCYVSGIANQIDLVTGELTVCSPSRLTEQINQCLVYEMLSLMTEMFRVCGDIEKGYLHQH